MPTRPCHLAIRQLLQILATRLLPAILLLLIALELCLQAGAWLVEHHARHTPAQWLTGHTRLLAIGDSNTYGLYLEEKDSWPRQLETLWNREHPGNPVEVLNLGYPGTNSFRTRENFPLLMKSLAPDIVFIMIGFNDFWTPNEKVDAAGWRDTLDRWLLRSRVYRLWMIWQRSRIEQDSFSFGSSRQFRMPAQTDEERKAEQLLQFGDKTLFMGVRDGEPARNMRSAEPNIAAMVALARAAGAKVYLLTYPSSWGFYPPANRWLRQTARDHQVPLIDITPLFSEKCVPDMKACPDLLFHDGHATAAGNTMVARQVANQLAHDLPGQ